MKAFSLYSVSSPSESAEVTVQEDSDVEDDDYVFEDVHGLLQANDGSMEDLTQVQYELPPHQRCAAHMLNLVANNDNDKHLSSSPSSWSVYRSSFGKSVALWNKASRSTVSADKVQEVA